MVRRPSASDQSSQGFLDRALPAKRLVVELLRPSVSALDAFVATGADVCLPVPDCARTLPTIDFCLLLAEGLDNAFDAVLARVREV